MEPNMLLRSIAAASLAVALLVHVATPSDAATLISEDFNAAGPAFGVSTTIPSFTVTSGTVDVIGIGSGFDFYPGNGAYIDLSGNSAGSISSSAFSLNAGDTVTLTFLYGANGENRSADISFGSFFTSLTANQSFGAFQTFTTTFTVSSATSASLVFTGTTPGASGFVIDNVVLTSTAVPEPALLPALLTLGAVGGALVLRRKQSSEQA
jgi:hypothetical protein